VLCFSTDGSAPPTTGTVALDTTQTTCNILS
jgi:hypothetical protein